MNNIEEELLFRRELLFYFIKTDNNPVETAVNNKNFSTYSTWYITFTFDKIVTWNDFVYAAVSEICDVLELTSLVENRNGKLTASYRAKEIVNELYGKAYSHTNELFYYVVPNRTDDWECLLASAKKRVREYYINDFLNDTTNV